VLHAAQDFYSHSNWVEMTALTEADAQLVDSRIGPWREVSADWGQVRGDLGDDFGDVITSQQPLRPRWSVSYPRHRYVPVVTDPQGRRHHVLVSGEAGRGESCALGVKRFSHDELNKDESTNSNDARYTPVFHRRAATLATQQTRHEWCRLLGLVRRETGWPGVGVLLGLLADPNSSPHPQGTRCAAARPGPILVTVGVERIRVLDDKEGDATGQLNFVFALFSEDMNHSRARQIDTVRVESRARVPSGRLPRDITLCLRASDRIIATVQAWEDDDEIGADKGRTQLTEKDDLLSGTTLQLGRVDRLRTGSSPMRRSDNEHARDLEVQFTVRQVGPTSATCTESPIR
jgi:hypothetical protein